LFDTLFVPIANLQTCRGIIERTTAFLPTALQLTGRNVRLTAVMSSAS